MIPNPFTPAEIATLPDDFYGRHSELRELQRSLAVGSIAIQGPIGIGKSSLLARGLAMMEGFDGDQNSRSIIAVGHKDIQSVDSAARQLLEQFVQIDERHHRVRFSLGKVLEIEAGEIVRFFSEGRHLDALIRLIEADYLPALLSGRQFLVLAFDEADKCPVVLARLVRAVVTHAQHKGVKSVRFAVAGVSPYFQMMVDEDPGVGRFFYRALTLAPMPQDEARELLESKIEQLANGAEKIGIPIRCDPAIIDRVTTLSGGHPHLLQLLGSHLVENENSDPDGVIDGKDLVGSLRQICYEDRASVYDTTVHHLRVNEKLEGLRLILGLQPNSPVGIVSGGFPTRIDRTLAGTVIDQAQIHWLVEHNVLAPAGPDEYTLIDEFLRIRLHFDALDVDVSQEEFERRLLESTEYGDGPGEFSDQLD